MLDRTVSRSGGSLIDSFISSHAHCDTTRDKTLCGVCGPSQVTVWRSPTHHCSMGPCMTHTPTVSGGPAHSYPHKLALDPYSQARALLRPCLHSVLRIPRCPLSAVSVATCAGQAAAAPDAIAHHGGFALDGCTHGQRSCRLMKSVHRLEAAAAVPVGNHRRHVRVAPML